MMQGKKIKEAAEHVADKVQDAAEHVKPSIESTADKVKDAALHAADKVQDAAEHAKPSIENAADKAKAAAGNAADKVEDAAERVKPSNNQDTQAVDSKERIIIEAPYQVVTDTTVASGRESILDTEATPMDVYEETSEIEKRIFERQIDRPI